MKSVMNHTFAVAPSAEMPRSTFNRSFGHKLTLDAGYLVPVFNEEVIPGDTLSVRPNLFARLNTPINPIMDNLFLDTHWFFVPYRQLWNQFRRFMGERPDPSDDIDYTMPISTSPAGGYDNQSLQDYLGLPTKVAGYTHNTMHTRAYNHIYNEWFRDQNLIDSATLDVQDGPDTVTNYVLRRRGKRHDYFTSALPWLQRGDSVTLPLGTSAPVDYVSPGASERWLQETGTTDYNDMHFGATGSSGRIDFGAPTSRTSGNLIIPRDGIFEADLSTATASTVAQLRQAFQIQKLLERDARSGTRYAEIVKAHFGVNFIDVTYRPEFLMSTSTPINIHSVAQTSSTDGTSPQGNLSAFGTASSMDGHFTKSFTEHGVVMGIASVRADLTYQQGLHRQFSRSTRHDYYFPALAHLGEQSVLNQEIYCQGTAGGTDDAGIFGYQERWAEMRFAHSRISGKLRSNDAATLDPWHLSQEFSSLPALNQTFIEENPPIDRVVATTTEPDLIMDCYFQCSHVRPMPVYSVPGLIDHF